ncbi:hypothetical protein MAMC_01697 [Methylacidimicrobium cyclopophantes]|uniref:Uncharacterized protein n=2 Tax=Methylacidimicrobium cyclopophantes TaxID=1041766 RepID=A0A5E6MDE3_9BACT|nr:hypothetical protein MAMC_01697 [Methylacidimicrobium cyclopophantes]
MAADGIKLRSVGAGILEKLLRAIPAFFCLLFCVVAVPLQMILPSLPLTFAKPDLPAMLIAYAAMRLPLIPSFGLAAAAGLWRDLLTAGHLGPCLLAFTLGCILVSVLRQSLSLRSIWFFPGTAALATFVILGTAYIVHLLEHRQWLWSATAWGGFAIASLLTAIVALPVGWLFEWSWGLLRPNASPAKGDDLLEIELL